MKNPSSSSPIFNCNGSQNHLDSIVHFPTKSGHLSAETWQDVFEEPDIRLMTIMLAFGSIALLGGLTERSLIEVRACVTLTFVIDLSFFAKSGSSSSPKAWDTFSSPGHEYPR